MEQDRETDPQTDDTESSTEDAATAPVDPPENQGGGNSPEKPAS